MKPVNPTQLEHVKPAKIKPVMTAQIKPVEPINAQPVRSKCFLVFSFARCSIVGYYGPSFIEGTFFDVFVFRKKDPTLHVGVSVAVKNDEPLGAKCCFDGVVSVYGEPCLVCWDFFSVVCRSLFPFVRWALRFGYELAFLLPVCLFR